jgi:hypothetical protein
MRRRTTKDDGTAEGVSADTSAEAALAKMGYESELPRNLGMMSVLGLYVSICPCLCAPLSSETTGKLFGAYIMELLADMLESDHSQLWQRPLV